MCLFPTSTVVVTVTVVTCDGLSHPTLALEAKVWPFGRVGLIWDLRGAAVIAAIEPSSMGRRANRVAAYRAGGLSVRACRTPSRRAGRGLGAADWGRVERFPAWKRPPGSLKEEFKNAGVCCCCCRWPVQCRCRVLLDRATGGSNTRRTKNALSAPLVTPLCPPSCHGSVARSAKPFGLHRIVACRG